MTPAVGTSEPISYRLQLVHRRLRQARPEGSIVLRRKLSHTQAEVRLANLPPCLIGMEACVGAHHLSRRLSALGHDARLMPARYVKPFLKGQKNDFRDAEAIAEAVQRRRMRFVLTKSVEQLDLRLAGNCQHEPFDSRIWGDQDSTR